MDRPSRHKTAVEFAVDEIKRRIVEQEMLPGTRIDQTLIAEALGLSRIPIRQALANLAGRGFVQLQAHRSAVVAPLSATEVRDIYALRCRMEPWALEEAFGRFGEADFTILNGLIEAMVQSARDHDLARYMDMNREFHFVILARAKNPQLVRILQGLFDTSERYQWVYVNSVGNMELSNQEHREILALIRAHNIEGTIALSQHHSQKTADWLRSNVINDVAEANERKITRPVD